ncbi:OFA family MFS transporter [Streptomyces sp. TRM66268-LWL]|uniref:OFA family MFS transporter n=1 Tax=Streptomyces polyasparticus TaxID=2767826 RepID=A0ABR7SVB2_9ACTN|nr:OFA family MFS transporter [Streptomyces polyasparticus]MBC9719449.1 OFA family MFS transporter [Streptomyces polyasparticus]
MACAVVINQLAYGSVYAWSVFAIELSRPDGAYRLSRTTASLPFSAAIGMIFLGAFAAGRLVEGRGPRAVAVTAALLYCGGCAASGVGSTAATFWIVVCGYGLVGGFGLGMGYVVPTMLLQKWFPGRRALAAGIATGGFGLGAALAVPLTRVLIAHDPAHPARAFGPLALVFLLTTLAGAVCFVDPPTPAAASHGAARRPGAPHLRPAEAVRRAHWYLLTSILFCNTLAGICLLSAMTDIGRTQAGLTLGQAAAVTSGMAVCNAAGRPLWGWVADRNGPLPAMTLTLALQGAGLLAISGTTSRPVLLALAAVVCACFGGGFAVMPAATSTCFGLTHAAAIYGLILVGWSLAGLAGPPLFASLAQPDTYEPALNCIGALTLGTAVLPLITHALRAPTQPDPRHAARRPPAAARNAPRHARRSYR